MRRGFVAGKEAWRGETAPAVRRRGKNKPRKFEAEELGERRADVRFHGPPSRKDPEPKDPKRDLRAKNQERIPRRTRSELRAKGLEEIPREPSASKARMDGWGKARV
jgi:hypothetical protein